VKGRCRQGLARVLPLVGVLGLLAGCKSTNPKQEAVEPFLFRSLDLRQQDPQGRPAWSLTSPEARYDIAKRLAKARQPRGLIYRNGQPHYDIRANGGTVLNNGEVIQLEGAVVVTLLGPDPVRIHADQLRWIPRRDLMEIDRNPWASDQRSRLRAASARFYVLQDRLELKGNPQLEQWASAPKGRANPVGLGPADLVLRAISATWHPRSGVLWATGPVQGNHREANGSGQTLRARALGGNLRQQRLALEAPVQVVDSSRKAVLEAQRTVWDLAGRRLSSDQPFRARMDRLQVRGDRLLVDLGNETVAIPQACQLLQPGEQLRAQTCLWHWPNGQIRAQGSVVVRRQANRQVTRADLLQGRIGTNGLAMFSSPGTRVQSQLTLPPPGATAPAGSPGGPRRQVAPPVTF
jgi:LPS export ABC transporter protein LptC